MAEKTEFAEKWDDHFQAGLFASIGRPPTKNKDDDDDGPGPETRVAQAELRTERAETRTEQAKTRTEQAEIRTEQAETRTEQAKTRTEQAEKRTEQAEIRSEEAIRVSEFNYRRLFEAAREGILILEADSGRINDVNPFLIEMLGLSHEKLVGIPIWELGPFKDIVSNRARFEQLQQDGYALSDNLHLEVKGGGRIIVEFISHVYQTGDRKVLQCNIRDISIRRRAEEQLQLSFMESQRAAEEIKRQNVELERRVAERTAELQAANAELESFSYSVSHDLRAPIRHMLGFVEILKSQAGSALSAESLRHLGIINQSATRMGSLIDDLLAFSRLGKSALQKSTVNLDELVKSVVAEFQVEDKGVRITWEIHPLPIVQGDRALLRMVLVNLISNAVKFSGKRAAAKIEIGCLPKDQPETVIFIRDNGAGFDPRYANRLFGVFQRLHSDAEFEGTGIGLANIRRIVHRHGGRTWAEGVLDVGATFYFSIPSPAGC